MELQVSVPDEGTVQDDLSLHDEVQVISENTHSEADNQNSYNQDDDRVSKATLTLLASHSPTERASAARELGQLGGQVAVTHLVAALYDPSPEVCLAASESLERLGVPTAVEPAADRDYPDDHQAQPIAVSQSVELVEDSAELPLVAAVPISLDDLNSAYVESFPHFGSASSRIEEFPPSESLAEPQSGLEFGDEEFRAEAAAIRQAENELACRRAEAEARQRAKEENAQRLRLEAINAKAEEGASLRAEREQQLKAELDEIRRAQTQQLKRIEEAEAARTLQEEALRMFEVDARRCTDEEQRRIVELKTLKEAAEVESALRREEESKLQIELDNLEKSKSEVQKHLDEVSAAISAQQQVVAELEESVQHNRDLERQRSEQIERLRVEESNLQTKLAAIEESLARLDVLLRDGEARACERENSLNQINTRLAELAKSEVEQLKNLADVESQLSTAEQNRHQLELKIHEGLEREEQLVCELELLRKAEANATERKTDVEAQISRLQLAVQDEQQRLFELESVRQSAEAESSQRVEFHQSLVVAIEALDRANAEQLTKIAEAKKQAHEIQAQAALNAEEEKRLVAEAFALREAAAKSLEAAETLRQQTEAELQRQAVEKEQHLVELNSICEVAREAMLELEERERTILAEIETLRAEEVQKQQLLREAADRKLIQEEQARLTSAELQLRSEEERQRLSTLQALHANAKREAEERKQLENQVNLDLENLRQSELIQSSRIEMLRKETSQMEIHLTGRSETENGLKVQLERLRKQDDTRTKVINEKEREVEAEKQRAEEEGLRLVNLKAKLSTAESAARERSESEGQLHAEIAALMKAEAEQVIRLADATSQIQQQKAAEQSRLNEFEQLRSQAETESQKSTDLERQLKAEIESLRKIESKQLQLIKAAEVEVDERKGQEAKLQANLETLRIEETRQLKQIEEATSLLHQLQNEAALRAEEHARIRTEVAQIQETELADRRRLASERRQEVEAEGARRIAEEKQRIAELESIRISIEASVQQVSADTAQLETEVGTLRKNEAEQVTRLSVLQTQVEQAQQEAKRLAKQEADLQREVLEQQAANRFAVDELKQELEAQRNRRTREEEEKLAQLEDMRHRAESEAAELEKKKRQLQDQLDAYGKTRFLELERIAKLEVERNQCARAAEENLARLEEMRHQAESEAAEREEKKRQLQAQLDSYNKSRVVEHERISKLEVKRNRRAREEEGKLAQLKEMRRQAETEAAELEQKKRQLQEQLDWYSKTRLSELERIAELEAERNRRASEEDEHLSRLEELRNQAEREAVEREERERQLQAQLDSYRDVQVIEHERIEELEIELTEVNAKAELSPVTDFEFTVADHLPTPAPQIDLERAGYDLELSEPDLQSDPVVDPDLDADASFVILDFDQDASVVLTEISELRLDESQPLTRTNPEPNLTSEFESNSQAIDLVRYEKGIELASDQGSLPAFILDRLGSSDPAERRAGLVDLVQFGGDEAFSLISRAFDDTVTEVRYAAARALFDIDRDRAASFTRALREASVERRRRIGAALGGCGIANEAINALLDCSREKTYDAFSILFLMAKAGEIQPLIRAIENHSDVNVRLAVISLLTFSNQPETVPAFRRLAVRGSLPAEVRSALMEAIHQISSQQREQSAA